MGLFDFLKGDTKTQSVTNAVEPPSWLKPHLTFMTGAAQDIADTPLQYYSGDTTVGPSAYTQQALGQIGALAGQPNAGVTSANRLLGDTLGGKFLQGGNPYLQGAINSAINPLAKAYNQTIRPQIGNNASRVGRYGGNYYDDQIDRANETFAGQAGDISSQVAYQSYEAERARQNAAIPQAYNAAQAAYAPAQALLGAGALQEGYTAAEQQDAKARWDFAQMEPTQRLAMAQQFWTGMPYQTSTQSQEVTKGGLAGLVGGAMGGAQAGNKIAPGGWGAAAGGILGGLGGLFG